MSEPKPERERIHDIVMMLGRGVESLQSITRPLLAWVPFLMQWEEDTASFERRILREIKALEGRLQHMLNYCHLVKDILKRRHPDQEPPLYRSDRSLGSGEGSDPRTNQGES